MYGTGATREAEFDAQLFFFIYIHQYLFDNYPTLAGYAGGFTFVSVKTDLIVDFSEPLGVAFIVLANYLKGALCRKVDFVSKNGIRPAYYQAIEKGII